MKIYNEEFSKRRRRTWTIAWVIFLSVTAKNAVIGTPSGGSLACVYLQQPQAMRFVRLGVDLTRIVVKQPGQ